MGAVNYFTSDYITMGLRPYDSLELEKDTEFMEEMRRDCEEYGGTIENAIIDYIQSCYEDDYAQFQHGRNTTGLVKNEEVFTMTDYNKIAMDNLNALMREIAEYTRMAEEIGATLDSLKDTLKKHMEENGLDSIAGSEHKASYKAVTSSRIDTTALKRDMPEIAAKYTKTTETRRFLFV